MRFTREALERLIAPLAALSRAGWAALAVGGMAVLLGAAAWAARLRWVDAPWWVLAAWSLAFLAAGLVGWAAWQGEKTLATRRVAGGL